MQHRVEGFGHSCRYFRGKIKQDEPELTISMQISVVLVVELAVATAEAVMMVCSPKGSTISMPAAEDGPSPQLGAEGLNESPNGDTLSSLPSDAPKNQNSKPPILRRQSLALVLNAGDTGEVLKAGAGKNKRVAWWDTRAAAPSSKSTRKSDDLP